MKTSKQIVVITIFFLAITSQLLVLGTTAKPNEIEKGTLKVHGSNTLFPVTNSLGQLYEEVHPGVTVEGGGEGSSVGIKQLIDGEIDVAAASREPKESEYNLATQKGVNLTLNYVGLDGLAIFVNPANPVSRMTTDQITNIYNATTLYWEDIDNSIDWNAVLGNVGKDSTGKHRIKVIERDKNSGTHGYFNEFFLEDNEVPADRLGNAYYAAYQSTKDLVDAVNEEKNAIGYGGVAYLIADVEKVANGENPATVRPLKIAKSGSTAYELPTKDNIKNGAYPVARPLFYITNGKPDPATAEGAWITLAQSKEGQAIVEQVGYVAYFDNPKPYSEVQQFKGYKENASSDGFQALPFVIALIGVAVLYIHKKRKQT